MEHEGVVSSSVNSAKTKREKLIKNANYYKAVLKTWENAVSKAEGRKPGKNDLKTAPDSVQKAYKEYYKLKKYLEANSSCTEKDKNKPSSCSGSGSKGPSPSKIFFGRNNVRVGNLLSSPTTSSSNKTKSPISRKRPLTKKQSGILKAKESLNAKQQAKHAAGVSFNIFNERISFVVNILGNRSPSPKKSTPAATTTASNKDEDDDIHNVINKTATTTDDPRTRKILVPTRTSKSSSSAALPRNNSISISSFVNLNINLLGKETASFQEREYQDEADEVQVPPLLLSPNTTHLSNYATVVHENSNDSSQMSRKRNSVGVICHSFSPNVKNKTSTKQVDKKWLKRCRTDSQSEDEDEVDADATTEDEDDPSPATLSSTTTTTTIHQEAAPSTSVSQKVEYFNEAAQDNNGGTQKKGRKRRKLENGESLATRMKKGKANENFVKIDITKKVFVRGHKKVSGSKTKRNDWKMKKAFASKEDKLKSLVCRKCGETGHFGKFCMKGIIPTDEPKEIDDSPFPSLAEAASMVKSNHLGGIPSHRVNIYNNTETPPVSQEENNNSNFRLVAVSSLLSETIPLQPPACKVAVTEPPPTIIHSGSRHNNIHPIQPYFLPDHGLISEEEEDEILNLAIRKFGFEDFRPGQREVVSRILKGLSTLCILSTGSGKSLCYQLPAFLYAQKNPGALAICVSPLVSLMEDQVQGIPPFLHAEFLHSNMPSSQKEKVLEKIRARKIHILLVSPEAVCGGLFGLLRGSDFLPQISFACIDEVHCVSQWSHNFRPCYLQVAKILRDKLNVNTILGLTATATEYTANSICNTIRVDPSTTIRGEIIPDNLNLSASRDTYRDEALLALLHGERFSKCDSIIIYCTRRDECTRIAALIRTSLQEPQSKHAGITKINLRQRVSNTCEAYHAGMTAGKRRLVQQQFMSGRIRIVVATVAFGMGIDKSDIRSVIHYNMPKTFESYVQEIGRAGRDGEPAHCHLFLDNVKGRDLSELKRHVYSNSLDRATLRKLLRRVFQSCKCNRIAEFSSSQNGSTVSNNNNNNKPPNQPCPGHEVSFSIEETVQELDLPEENITTILCYLELDSNRKWIEILPHTYQTCKIHSYGGAALLKSSAMKCPPLAAAIALAKEKKKFQDSDVYLEFDVIEVSATLGWNSWAVKKELKNLEWAMTGDNGGGKFRKSGILVEFCNLAFHINSPGDLSDEDSDTVLNYLHNHNQEQEKTQLYQLHRVYQALLSISSNTVESISEASDEEKSNSLKKFIRTYFSQKTLGVPPEWKNEVTVPEHHEKEIRRHIGDLLASVKDAAFTGRSVARIFQGISSPCFPAEDWSRNRSFWRKHIDLDFHYLCKIASQEILRF